MDMGQPLAYRPPADWQRIATIESHTGGEPFRIVVDGAEIPGETVLERRRYAQENLDDLRRALMWEPRGHADMYGAFIGAPTTPSSDISVLFMHNEGFSTMCGHGIIALTKVALETGLLPITGDKTTIGIDAPAGQIMATATVKDGVVDRVSFRNVPSFAVDLDNQVAVPDMGTIRYDLAFGGAFYAYVEASSVGLDMSPNNASRFVQAGRTIKRAIMSSREIQHPFEPDLGFLYAVIFTGPPQDPSNHSQNVCVFADGELDRSPTGTGVSGRLAILHARGEIEVDQPVPVESIVGSVFTGRVAEITKFGQYDAVIPEVEGTAYITGRSEYWFDPEDELGRGFFLR